MRAARSLAGLALGSVVVGVALTWWLLRDDRAGSRAGTSTLTVHCAAGIKGPVVQAAKEYEGLYGHRVELTFGGSGTLLSALAVRAHGDLYIAGDDSYVANAGQRGLVAEQMAIAKMRPVLVVAKGNPKRVTHFEDLLREDVRVGFGDPEAAAVGRITKRVATELGLWDRLAQGAAVSKPTVNELGNDLKIGTIDAAVIWDATARQYPELEIVVDPRLAQHVRHVTLGVLTASEDASQALHFARFLTARDRGLVSFAAHGFMPVDGDVWHESPELRLMSGAMLRPAIDATIKAFEARERVRVDVVYDGCGILVSQMKVGAVPDAYFACDASFLTQVADRFDAGVTVSANEIVILVAKGNPKKIRTLGDLLVRADRIGVGHPQKSALGALTRSLLESTGHHTRLQASGRIAVESATGDLLVNQILAGSLDAVLVYRSNTAHVRERGDVVTLGAVASQALATQPYAIAKDSRYPQLMERLLRAIRTTASQQRFESLGFRWREDRKPR